jgi:hypothetical protein
MRSIPMRLAWAELAKIIHRWGSPTEQGLGWLMSVLAVIECQDEVLPGAPDSATRIACDTTLGHSSGTTTL